MSPVNARAMCVFNNYRLPQSSFSANIIGRDYFAFLDVHDPFHTFDGFLTRSVPSVLVFCSYIPLVFHLSRGMQIGAVDHQDLCVHRRKNLGQSLDLSVASYPFAK